MNDVGHAPLPGDVLLHQYLQPNNITMYRLAKAMNLPQITVSGIIRGKRRITTSLAYHLAYVLGTSPEYWLELQMNYDIENYDKFDESGLTVLIDNTVGEPKYPLTPVSFMFNLMASVPPICFPLPRIVLLRIFCAGACPCVCPLGVAE